jgi:hypothetical protein
LIPGKGNGVGAHAHFPEIERPGREARHALPAYVEVKKMWSCIFMAYRGSVLPYTRLILTAPGRLQGFGLGDSWQDTGYFPFKKTLRPASCLVDDGGPVVRSKAAGE